MSRNRSARTVTFTGSEKGSPQSVAVYLTIKPDDDATDETVTVSIPAKSTGEAPILVATGLSGGATGSRDGNGEITVTDKHEVGLTFSSASVSVTEGGSNTYTVKLDTQPTETVTVTITSDDTDVTVDTDSAKEGNQLTLTFNRTGSTKRWNVPQTVTVNAGQDEDAANESVTLTHDASGGDYAAVDETLEVTVTDDDEVGLIFSPTSVSMTEGGSSTYTVKLATQPNAAVTITIDSNNADVAPDTDAGRQGNQTMLTFSPTASATLWSKPQTVTVNAAADADTATDKATLTHDASGGGYGSVTEELAVTVTDTTVPVVSIARTSGATMTEGATATFTVTASPTPASALTVRLKVADVANADFIAPSHQGAQTVTVPTGGSVTYEVVTVNDSGADADGEVTVTVMADSADPATYTVSGTDSAASVTVNDDDATTVVLTTPDTAATEGNRSATAQMVLTLGRALRIGERLAVPLAFSGGARGTDFTLALSGTPTGVTFAGQTVTFAGRAAGSATVATVTLTAEDDADAEDESITVSIPAAHTGNPPILGATGLSGGASGSRVGNGVITVTDDDEVGLTFSPTSVSVDEGDTGTYTVVLDTQPTAAVTVTIASDNTDVTVDTDAGTPSDQTTLTFSPTASANLWSKPQTVTVNAGQDEDAANESVTVTHDASGGDYASVAEDLAVTVTDDDEVGLTFSPASVSVDEGASKTYTVKLTTKPTAPVTVTITSNKTEVTVDTDAGTPSDQTTLTFNPTGSAATLWSTARTVIVSAARDDASTTYAKATLTHTAAGAGSGYGSVEKELVVTVTDTTVPVVSITRTSDATMTEGATATFTVTASPTPATALTVRLKVADVEHADFIAASSQGTKTVTVPTGGTATYTVATQTDSIDEPDGAVTVTVIADPADPATYTVSGTGSAASVTVNDDDATTVVLKVEDSIVEEDSSNDVARLSLTLNRALRDGESLVVPLAFSGIEDKLILLGNVSGKGASRQQKARTVTFTGSSGGSVESVNFALKMKPDADATDETVTVSIPAKSTGEVPILVATGLSGGATGSRDGNGEITVTDNDEVGLTFSSASVSVTEGGSNTYTIKLDTQPTETVTVTITSDDAGLTIADTDTAPGTQNTLTFSPTASTNLWSKPQTVTVNAGQDEDAANESVTLTHDASGGDYAAIDETLEVTVTDDDTAGLVFSPASVSLTEGGTQTYTVRLSTQPTAAVTVTIASDNTDVTADTDSGQNGIQNTLTFNPTGANLWSTARTVTVNAAADADTATDKATLMHDASGGGYGSVAEELAVTVTDTTVPVVSIERTSAATMTEGGTATFTVTASPTPASALTVRLNVADVQNADFIAPSHQGAQTVTIPTGGSVTYSVVTVNDSGAGADEPDGEVTVTVMADSADPATYTVDGTDSADSVTVNDNDATTVTLTTPDTTATEGSSSATAQMVLTLGRALRAGEVLAVPLGFNGGARGTDFTLALSGTPTGVTFSGQTVTFSGSSGGSATAATVTLTAEDDADAEDESITVSIPAAHSGSPPILGATGLSGGATGSRDGNGEITVTDDDEVGLTFSLTSVSVTEGGSSTYTVKLATQPSAAVTVTISSDNTGVTVDTDAGTPSDQTTLTFNPTGANLWSTARTVTVNAAADADTATDKATLTHDASGGGYGSVAEELAVTVTDTTVPVVSIERTSAATLTEGGTATFTVTASPTPASALTVRLNVADVQNADFIAPSHQGAQTVTIPTGGSVTHSVVTQTDSIDEPNGTVTVTVSTGTDYTVSGTDSAASVTVNDDDATTVVLTTPDTTATEGSATATAEIRLTLGRALRTGERLTVPLAFSGGVRDTDFTLALSGTPDGVAFAGHTVTFTGRDAGSATVATVVLTALEDANATDETVTVSIPAAHTGSPPILGATGLSGGANGRVTPHHGTITVEDDDDVGLTFSPASVSVTEGGSGSYTVMLDTQPIASVTVTIASDNTDVTMDTDSGTPGNQTTLIFSPTASANLWSKAQTVTVNVGQDEDAADDAVTLTHTATGGDYAAVEEDLAVTVTDNDTAGLVFSPTSVSVDEGASNTYTVKLTTQPSAPMTLTITSDNTNVTVDTDAETPSDQTTLTFNPTGSAATLWSTARTVTVSAARDDISTTYDEAMLTHTAAGAGSGYGSVEEYLAVTVTDTTVRVISSARISNSPLIKGGTASFTVTAHFEVGSAEVEEDVGPVRVAILLDPPPDSMASLHYTVSGTATAALPGAVFPGEEADYRIEPGDRGTVTAAASGCAEEPTCLSGTITVPADTERVVIPLQIHDDARDEPDETVVLTLDHAEGGPDRLHTHTLTIIDNDVPLITILPGESPVEEGTAVSFLLAADPVPYRDLAVHLALSEHGTYLGEDVARQPAVVFPAQANTATWQGATQDDGVAEADGSVTATVRPGDGYQVGEPSSATVRVTDDERPRSAALAGWLVRFGRSVAEAVIGGVSTRWEAPRTPGLSGTLAGVGLSGDSPREAPLGTDQEGDPDDRGLTVAELLGESEFTWTGETDEQGRTAGWWGRVSSSTFEGAEATFTVDGEVTTGLIGLDVVRGDWLGGVALGVSEGDGTYALDSGETGDMTASLGALIPYGQRHLAPGRTAWALAGAGQGDLTLVPVADPVSRTGIGWRMLAGGLTESLMVAPGDGGFGLSAKTDGLWMQTDSAAVSGLEATRSAITRWRGGLEGTWDQVLWDGARLTPTLEVGLRHDAGDAETGWGVEWGAGLTWMDPVRGLELSLEGRGLVDHQDRAFRTRGVGASLAYDPSPDSELGWSLTVGQTLGDAHSGGMDALFAPGPLSGERGRTGSMDRQWTAEAAYGLPTRGGRFTGSPHVALTVGGTDRTAAMGWRWTPTGRQTDLAVGVTATRTDRPDAAPDHAIVLEASRRW